MCKHKNKYTPILQNHDVGWIEWCKDCGAIRSVSYYIYHIPYAKAVVKKDKWRIPEGRKQNGRKLAR